jgi:hypothetical protein
MSIDGRKPKHVIDEIEGSVRKRSLLQVLPLQPNGNLAAWHERGGSSPVADVQKVEI